MKLNLLAILAFTGLAVAIWGFAATDVARAVPPPPGGGVDVYSAKFLCGTVPMDVGDEGPVKPGNYQTAINVHNPSTMMSVAFDKKAVLLFDATNPPLPEEPRPPGPLFNVTLLPNWGLEIDCNDIRTVLLAGIAPPAPAFIKGWVVIDVPTLAPLDVVAAYTAHGFDAAGAPEGFSLEVVPIEPTNVMD